MITQKCVAPIYLFLYIFLLAKQKLLSLIRAVEPFAPTVSEPGELPWCSSSWIWSRLGLCNSRADYSAL